MHRRRLVALTAAVLTLAGVQTVAGKGTSKSSSKSAGIVVPAADVAWKEAGIPGVMTATVAGDMAKGPSHFFLKYAAGFATPPHHHTADHYVTVMKGTLVLTVDGKEQRLAPGSFFALTGKKSHVGRCDGSEDCVMFVDARAAWDVVPEGGAAAKK